MKSDIERKIAEYADKLKSLNGPDDKRIKKRVLAALGKLKKELAGLDSSVDSGAAESVAVNHSGSAEVVNATEATKNTETTLTRKQLKAKLKLLNKELADYAQKKQLKVATKRFSWGVRKGMEPDKHTYANLLNCHVRCGDLDGALHHFAEMLKANLSPNIVIYTVLLKGYCDKGDLAGARNLFFTQIPSCKLTPGIRTVNAFIRGCTKIGAANSALSAYNLLKCRNEVKVDVLEVKQKGAKSAGQDKKRKRSDEADDDDGEDDNGICSEKWISNEEPENDENSGNASLFESVVALLCQALQVERASVLAMDAVNSVESLKGNFPFDHTSDYDSTPCSYTQLAEHVSYHGIMNTGKLKTSNTTDFASMYANLSKACLFTGKCEEAQKWLDCALTALEGSKSSQLRNSMQQNRENESRKNNNEDGLKDAKRSKSIDLFLRHRRAEIESEVESISHCLSALKSLPSLRLKGAQEQALKIGFMHTLSRVLHFGFNGSGDHDDCCYPGDCDAHHASTASTSSALNEGVTSSNALILAVKDKFGLDRVLESPSAGINTSDTLYEHHQLLYRECKDDVAAKLSRSLVRDTGFIDFNEFFSTVKRPQSATSPSAMDVTGTSDEEDVEAETDSKENALPVNIEICSGSGEWVVSHAASDLYYRTGKHDKRDTSPAPAGASPRALWLALELRCDRVYHTICRSVLQNIVRHSQHAREASIADSVHIQSSPPLPLSLGGLPNLAVIGGDASHILPNRIAPGSIANVYINHPEPPERTGGVGDSEGQHLLTQSFFSEIHRILSNEGKCTIVTDNLPYAKSLLQALGKTAVSEAKSSSSLSRKVYFSSVSLASSVSDSKGRVLEEEVVISTSQSSSGSANQRKEDVKKAEVKAKRSNNINSSDDDDDGDDGEGNDDEDDFTYINDEDAVPVNGDIKSVINKAKAKAKVEADSSQKKAPRGSIKRNEIKQNTIVESAQKGLESKIQVLQLWRGDSSDGNDDDGNGDDRASSYFDRMWERGQKKRRYFMVLQKG